MQQKIIINSTPYQCSPLTCMNRHTEHWQATRKRKQENITCAKCCSTYSSVYTNTYRLLLDWHGMSCCLL